MKLHIYIFQKICVSYFCIFHYLSKFDVFATLYILSVQNQIFPNMDSHQIAFLNQH